MTLPYDSNNLLLLIIGNRDDFEEKNENIWQLYYARCLITINGIPHYVSHQV